MQNKKVKQKRFKRTKHEIYVLKLTIEQAKIYRS